VFGTWYRDFQDFRNPQTSPCHPLSQAASAANIRDMQDKQEGNQQDNQFDVNPESEPTDTPDKRPISKSRFNDAEYRRWSEHLRRQRDSKGK